MALMPIPSKAGTTNRRLPWIVFIATATTAISLIAIYWLLHAVLWPDPPCVGNDRHGRWLMRGEVWQFELRPKIVLHGFRGDGTAWIAEKGTLDQLFPDPGRYGWGATIDRLAFVCPSHLACRMVKKHDQAMNAKGLWAILHLDELPDMRFIKTFESETQAEMYIATELGHQEPLRWLTPNEFCVRY